MGSKRGREFVASPDAGEQHDTWFGDPEARGWFLESLDNLCDPVRGIPYGIVQTGEPDPDGVPTVRCGDIKGFEIDRAGLKRVRASIESGYERTRLAGGEVLLAIRGTVGQTAVAGPELHGANISREVAMIPLLAGIEPTFVMYLLASPAGQAMLGQHVKGVAQAGINLADLRALRVPIPSRAEQARVVAEVERGLSVVNRMQRRTLEVGSESAELDRALLSAAFRGQLLDRQSSPGLDV
jgi:type I restriction enzyme S subunit